MGDPALLRGTRGLRLLLDTHVLLWWLEDSPDLDERARGAIASPVNEVLVSAATVWEVEIKRALGRLEAPDDLAEQVDGAGLERLPITFEHAREAGRLPLHHGDPFDRMLVAQARVDGLTIATRDDRVGRYDVRVLAA